MNAQTPQKFTLEEIAERKKKLLNEIHAQKKAPHLLRQPTRRMHSCVRSIPVWLYLMA